MTRKILGLDIRHDALSAVLVKNSIKENVIESYESVSIPDQQDFESGMAASLETIVEKMNISGSICIASFPADQISYRNIQVPFKGLKKISKILPFELEPTIPFPVDDLIIDFYTLPLSDHNDHTDLIAAAVEKSKLQLYLGILASFDIEPEIVTVGGYSTALCLNSLVDTHENWLFADIDKSKCTVFGVLSGKICLIRSFPIPSETPSFNTEMLCTNIQRTLSAFEEIVGLDFHPDGVFITGCGLDDSDIEQDMERFLELSVKRTDLVSHIEIEKQHHPAKTWDPCQMDNAFSLALMEIEGVDGFNFRKGPFAAKKIWVEHKTGLIKAGVLAAMVLALAFFNVVLDSYFLKKKLTGLDDQITKIFTSTFPDVKSVDPYQQMRIEIEAANKNALLPGKTDKHIRTIDILNNISKLIPKETDVKLTRLVVGEDSVQISGNTDTFNSVDDIKSRLEQVNFFQKITISSANINKSDKRVQFKLQVHL
jgi:type II secretory pathway component PulL